MIGAVTAGIVLIIDAPEPTPRTAEDPRRSTHLARVRNAVATGNWELLAAKSSEMAVEFPGDAFAWVYLALARERLGRPTAAQSAWEHLDGLTEGIEHNPGARYDDLHRRGWALWAKGQHDGAKEMWTRGARQLIEHRHWRQSYIRARLCALAGMDDEAYEALAEAIRGSGYRLAALHYEPDLERLRSEPRFAEFIAAMEAERQRVREARRQGLARPEDGGPPEGEAPNDSWGRP